MKTYYQLILALIYVFFSLPVDAQSIKSKSAGEVIFNDSNLTREFNKIYLLQSGEFVIVKNLCSSEEIAICLKKYFDISNKLALTYQSQDSLSSKIIDEYKKIDQTVSNINLGLNTISEQLQKVNLRPSINLLEKSNATLESSNRQLDSAVVKLNEINSDLTGIQFANLWSILAAGIAGFIAGALVFH